MRVSVFSTQPYDREFLDRANRDAGHELKYFKAHLNGETVSLAYGYPGVAVFVNDTLDAGVLRRLHENGTGLIALRCAGFNNVDIEEASKLGMTVMRVPAYSPYSVAEHTIGLILSLNRKFHRAHQRVREGNFSLNGLMGFDLFQKTVGIIGTGRIGIITANILKGFGCRIIAFDSFPNMNLEKEGLLKYVTLEELFSSSDIITLHCPLTPGTYHLIGRETVEMMKEGVMLINTSRGALIDAQSAVDGLKSGKIGSLGLDVYEEEGDIFYEDLSNEVIQDDILARLLTYPNVLITAHQAFFTKEALTSIAETTIGNLNEFEKGSPCGTEVTVGHCLVKYGEPQNV